MVNAVSGKVLAIALMSVLAPAVFADEAGGYATQNIIDGTVGRDAQGLLGINMASGDLNLQSNATSIALSEARGRGVAHTSVVQSIEQNNLTMPDVSVAKIDGSAFANASGAIGINQASGAANAQANSVAIAFGVGAEVTAETELAQTVTGNSLPTALTAEGQQRHTSVSDTAFSGARGIVQLNQSAGAANATGNSFALRFQMDTPQ